MRRKIILVSACFLILATSCSTYKYFNDSESRDLQHKLRGQRTGNVFLEGFKFIGSVIITLITNSDIVGYNPEEKTFRNLVLSNTSKDTLFVNMLSDTKWDEEKFCDFMDIRIPPGKNCRMLVPKFTNYNIYFSNTPEPDDDEKIEINTNKFRKIALYSGLSKKENPNNE
jgi:hypothetical protein